MVKLELEGKLEEEKKSKRRCCFWHRCWNCSRCFCLSWHSMDGKKDCWNWTIWSNWIDEKWKSSKESTKLWNQQTYPLIQDFVGTALDQLSTKVRSDIKYKTDRPELDRRTGGGIDVHKWIGKLPRPKAGWSPGKYKYMGPYTPLDQQLSYNPETGEVTEWEVKPYNKVDENSSTSWYLLWYGKKQRRLRPTNDSIIR